MKVKKMSNFKESKRKIFMLSKQREGEELNADALKKYLFQQKLISSENLNIEISQFSNGFSNLTYLLEIDNKSMVLRRPPKGAIKRGHDMGREFKVLSQLNQHFDKAPQAFCFEKSGTVLDAPFYIMEKIEGVIVNYKIAKEREITSHEFKQISDSWLDAFVEFHQLDFNEVGLSDLGKPEGYVERQVANWSRQYLRAATQEIPEAHFVMQWMHKNQPKEYNHSLIHNDFKYDNIVLNENDWSQVNAILDWEMCTLGDPLMDLGTSIAYWTMDSDGPAKSMGIPSPTILPGNPGRTELVNAYAVKSGRAINNLVFYYVYGLFKIAVIVQQIFYRYNKGLTQDKKFAKLNEVCAFLCMMATQAIDKKRIDGLF